MLKSTALAASATELRQTLQQRSSGDQSRTVTQTADTSGGIGLIALLMLMGGALLVKKQQDSVVLQREQSIRAAETKRSNQEFKKNLDETNERERKQRKAE